MKIALLNLQYDNNYGGNLQRYALIRILQQQGHDVTHLNLRYNFYNRPWYRLMLTFAKRIVKILLFQKNVVLFAEERYKKRYEESCSATDVFYNKYIPHTNVIGSKKDLQQYTDFDAFIVGSDQVWRKSIAKIYGIDTFFFDYMPKNIKTKRVAYGVSLGTDVNELNEEDLRRLSPLYKRFDSVSVREDSALSLFKQYGWTIPEAEWVLDPTLLLSKDDYVSLIKNCSTRPSDGNLFCYILDMTDDKAERIVEVAKKKNLTPFSISLDGKESIEQWLRSFADAEYVVTDSYHGLVFSIIFNKHFLLIRNQFRGSARFDAIFKACNIKSDDGSDLDWSNINNNLRKMQTFSKEWLSRNIV